MSANAIEHIEKSAGGPSPTEYIQHHLTNLTVGEGFWKLHIDTLAFSIILGLLFYQIGRAHV